VLNDLFYFSQKELNLRDLHSLLSEVNVYSLFLTENCDALQVGFGEKIIWQIYQMNISADFSDEDILDIGATGAKTCFCISYHNNTLNQLKLILIMCLETFGGWVGSDSDGFEPKLTLENIDFL
jgi:hypothetical protein